MQLLHKVILILFICFVPLQAQELPLADRIKTEHIIQEISGDASYEHIRFMTQYHRPGGGADGLWHVAEYVAERAAKYGLEEVRIIKQDYSRPPWNSRFADLRLTDEASTRIASTIQSQLHIADYSRPVDITAEVVYVGAGTEAGDYADKNVSGSIVLAHGSIGAVMREAVWSRGAAGIIWFPDPEGKTSMGIRHIHHPDQIHWRRVPLEGPNGEEGTFAFVLSLQQGLDLLEKTRNSEELFRVHAYIDASFDSEQGDQPWQVMVEARINGTEPGLGQDIMVTAHIQEEKFSANDNASGSANILEMARALKKLIDEGKLDRPRRTIRFWWVREFSSQRQYFADNPDAHRRMWVNINQDMVGAHQAQDVMRVQNITRLPASRFHFFNDVVESVVEYMIDINNTELAQIQAGTQFNPVYAHLGTRHRFNAKMVYFHGNTDHVTFNETPIGVPGITFTNWPDNYIHTSDDDLWNIDRTQLQRNAAAGALMAYIMADANSESFQKLAAETAGRGAQRLAFNKHLAFRWVAAAEDPDAAYHNGRFQIEYAVERERKAIQSLLSIDNGLTRQVEALLDQLNNQKTFVLIELDAHYNRVTGRRSASRYALSDAERSLTGMKLRVTGTPRDFLNSRGRVSTVPGLHNLMAFEILNCINGERTGLEIYRYVAAQAREAGEHYYGTVTPELVLEYLEKIQASELVGG
jgi:hypothetical protein